MPLSFLVPSLEAPKIGRDRGSFTHQSLNMTERYLWIVLKPFICASLYLASHGQFHNYSFTQLSFGSLVTTTEILKWSCRPSWLLSTEESPLQPKWSYFTATEHLLVKPWQSSSDNLGSQKLFTAVSSWYHLVPSAIRKRRVCRKDKTALKELDEEQVMPPKPEAPQWSFSCYPGRVLLPTASPDLREQSYSL